MHLATGLLATRSVETLKVDFHTHTTASDGHLDPTALLQRSLEAEIALLAMTDHDTLSGWAEVKDSVPEGLRLIPGIEVSCVWGGTTIHVVALGLSYQAPVFTELLTSLEQARKDRAEVIGQRLAKAGFPGALDGAREVAGREQVGRPHFAHWLVETGAVESMNTAFDRYLGQGKIGDVKTFWPTLTSAVRALVEADGVPVLAHPLHYKMTRTKLRALCSDFVEAGGMALEVLNGRQREDELTQMIKLAQSFGLEVSVGSDFHRDWDYGPKLGVDTARVGSGVKGVWERWL